MMAMNKNKEILKLVGKTIQSIEFMPGEYGRTYKQYICIVCTDSTRIMFAGEEIYNPRPNLKDMEGLTNFFTPEDIAKKAKENFEKKQQAEKDSIERKRREYESLKKELGEQ